MTALNLTTDLDDAPPDHDGEAAAALFDADQPDDGDAPAPRPVDLTDHAAGILYQARTLTVGDLLGCGAGMCSAVEDLALALDGGDLAHLKGAALDLIDVTHATQGHRARLDARPPTRAPVDGPREMYPRDVMTAAPLYSHADRRAPMIASIGGMAGFLATAPTTPERMGP